MTWEGTIPKKRRKSFERFLEHDDARIRAIAKEMQAEDELARNPRDFDTEFDENAAALSTFQADSE